MTIKQVAQKAGYSKAAVSLALRNHSNIPEATRLYIQRIAQELGYRPDPALAKIAAARWQGTESTSSSHIAYLQTYPRDRTYRYLELRMSGAIGRADALGHLLSHFRSEDFASDEEIERIFKARGVSGILLAQSRYTSRVPSLRYENYAVVALGFAHAKSAFHLVRDDSFQSLRVAWEEVRRHGYRRFGFIFLGPDGSENEFRQIAVAEALAELTELPAVALPRLHWGQRDLPTLQAWIERHRPDAVIGFDHRVAQGLERLGYRVPGDIGFASLDNSEAPGELSGIDHHPSHSGAAAIDFLDLLIRNGDVGIPKIQQVILVGTHWSEGKSLPIRAMAQAGVGVPPPEVV